LLDNDFIKKEDVIGKGSAQIADGSLIDTYHLILRDVEIGGLHLYNVEASISASQNAPLLLGQSAIQKLGKISIDGNKLIINSIKSNVSTEDIAKLRKEIDEATNNKRYLIALEKLEELKKVDSLTAKDLWNLAFTNFAAKKYKESISAGLDFIKNSSPSNENQIGIICSIIGLCFEQINSDSEAELYYKKALEYSYDDKREYEDIYYNLGNLFIKMKQYDNAQYYIDKGFDLSIRNVGCTLKDIDKGIIQDRKLANLLNRKWAICSIFGQYDLAQKWLRMSAQCGNVGAQKECIRNGIKYKIKTPKK
jgi:tetratricopeptide (TPR) repeat protein